MDFKNFKIRNAASEVAEIDIIGDIGENWFGDGITFNKVKGDLDKITSNKIIVNIASLGGDASEAFAMHDYLKLHDAEIETRIFGATASSGTIISVAGNKKTMAENALFLVHNVWTFAIGNQHDLRNEADQLEKWDGRLVNMYTKVTNKSEDEINELLKEEKWISAEEAKEWGFIDEILEPENAAASMNKIDVKKINACKELPKLPDDSASAYDIIREEIKSGFREFKNYFKSNKIEMSEEKDKKVVQKTEELDEKVTAAINAKVDEVKAGYDEKITELEINQGELESKISELETQNTEAKTELAKVNGIELRLASVEDPERNGAPAKSAKDKAYDDSAQALRETEN